MHAQNLKAHVMGITFVMAALEAFQIFVRVSPVHTATLDDITPETTIEQIMMQIEKKEGIPPDMQQLYYGGKQLHLADTAKMHKLERECTLRLKTWGVLLAVGKCPGCGDLLYCSGHSHKGQSQLDTEKRVREIQAAGGLH